jgi:hypothetical protein
MLYAWLTGADTQGEMRRFLKMVARRVLAGELRLPKSARIPNVDKATPADTILGLTAVVLSRAYGEEAREEVYDLKTWVGTGAIQLGLMVDYDELANRLLRKHVPEYVPSEAHGVGEGGERPVARRPGQSNNNWRTAAMAKKRRMSEEERRGWEREAAAWLEAVNRHGPPPELAALYQELVEQTAAQLARGELFVRLARTARSPGGSATRSTSPTSAGRSS